MTEFVRFVNLTPHTIRLLQLFGNPENPGWEIIDIEPSGGVARIAEFQTAPNRGALPPVLGVECVSAPVEAGVHGLPEPTPGVAYLVSSRLLRAVPDRYDVFCPDTSEESAVRDDNGQIWYVRRLIMCGGPRTAE
jgi:hypothetical protein